VTCITDPVNYLSFLDTSLEMRVVRRVTRRLTIDLNSSKNLVRVKSTLVEGVSVLF